jgi:hypothetical protein
LPIHGDICAGNNHRRGEPIGNLVVKNIKTSIGDNCAFYYQATAKTQEAKPLRRF